MNKEDLLLKATVTGKRQITIPQKICKTLNIVEGDKIYFKKEGDKIIFDVEEKICFACNGKKTIGKNECFLCNGKGKVSNDFSKNIFNIIGYINMYSRKYNIEITFLQQELDDEGMFKHKEIPAIILKSENYPINELNRIQDEIQKLVIKYFSPRNIENKNSLFLPSNATLNIILNTLVNDNSKEEVRNWFR